MTDVLMPALSPTMEEAALAKWLVKVGDKVRSGDVIAEIETDKATMEVEAVDEGVVAELLVTEGTQEVKVNTPIARLEGEDGASSEPTSAVAEVVREKAPPAEVPIHQSALVPEPFVSTRSFRPVSRWSNRVFVMLCATLWPRRCAAIRTSS